MTAVTRAGKTKRKKKKVALPCVYTYNGSIKREGNRLKEKIYIARERERERERERGERAKTALSSLPSDQREKKNSSHLFESREFLAQQCNKSMLE